MGVTNKHDERLKKVLQKCLTNYTKTSNNDKTVKAVDVDQNINNKTSTAVPFKIVYLTYFDVLNNNHINGINFKMSIKNERFHLIDKTTKSKELNYYRFSDGKVFYVNGAKYAKVKYYAKIEIFPKLLLL